VTQIQIIAVKACARVIVVAPPGTVSAPAVVLVHAKVN